jgi:hypothetical protein
MNATKKEARPPVGGVSEVAQAGPSSSAPVHSARNAYSKLVEAIRRSDWAETDALRERWEEIRAFVEATDSEPELDPEKRAALVIWLSTPPPATPLPWTRESSMPGFVVDERNQQINLLVQLLAAWLEPIEGSYGILAQLDAVLETSFARRKEWVDQARTCFGHPVFHSLVEDLANHPGRALHALAGYVTVPDQQLASCPDLTKVRFRVLGTDQDLILRLEGAETVTNVSLSTLAQEIGTRANFDQVQSKLLAWGLTLSLPAHADILPRFTAEVDQGDCWLISTRSGPMRRVTLKSKSQTAVANAT